MKIAALIIGIGGWDNYTRPLIESIIEHEPNTQLIVIDNGSLNRYPPLECVYRIDRCCYSKAINIAHDWVEPDTDWFIVLSNDVVCTGSFSYTLEHCAPDSIFGPQLHREHGLDWIVGWCVAIPSSVWHTVGGWDEKFSVSSWEDVDYSQMALENGFNLCHVPTFPFRHLDQKQRFTIVEHYWQSESHNRSYFMRKHGLQHA